MYSDNFTLTDGQKRSLSGVQKLFLETLFFFFLFFLQGTFGIFHLPPVIVLWPVCGHVRGRLSPSPLDRTRPPLGTSWESGGRWFPDGGRTRRCRSPQSPTNRSGHVIRYSQRHVCECHLEGSRSGMSKLLYYNKLWPVLKARVGILPVPLIIM